MGNEKQVTPKKAARMTDKQRLDWLEFTNVCLAFDIKVYRWKTLELGIFSRGFKTPRQAIDSAMRAATKPGGRK